MVGGKRARLGHDGIGDGLHVGQAVEACREVLDGAHACRLVGDRLVEPGIADRHRRLVGERLGQRQLVVGPFSIAGVVEADDPERPVVAHQRHEACGLDPLAPVGRLHPAQGVARIGVTEDERPPLSDRAHAERVARKGQRADGRQEVFGEASRGSGMEWMLALVQEPEAHLVGVEERAGSVRDVIENHVEVQLSGQLLGDVAQGPRASHLAPRLDEGPCALHVRRDCVGHRVQEGGPDSLEGAARITLEDHDANRLARGSQRDLEMNRHGCVAVPSHPVGIVGRSARLIEGFGRGDLVATVSLQVEKPIGSIASEVDSHAIDAEMAAQRFDGPARHRCRAG